jgi:hypothetical protein
MLALAHTRNSSTKWFSISGVWFVAYSYTCTALPLELGTTQLKQFDDAITSEVFKIMGVRQEHRDVDMVSMVRAASTALGPGRYSDASERCQHAGEGAAAGA